MVPQSMFYASSSAHLPCFLLCLLHFGVLIPLLCWLAHPHSVLPRALQSWRKLMAEMAATSCEEYRKMVYRWGPQARVQLLFLSI